MIATEVKKELMTKFGRTPTDTGSPEVQVAILTTRINELQTHFQEHNHDFHSKRGLMKMIGKRKSLLKFLQGKNEAAYLELIKELGLRK